MKEVNEMMYEEQKKLIKKLATMDPESDEYETVLNRIKAIDVMLSDDAKIDKELEIKREQNDKELEFKREQSDKELTVKREQMAEQKKERYMKYGIEVGLGILTLGFNWIWMKRGLKFEETGHLCSKTFSNLISGFKPKRK